MYSWFILYRSSKFTLKLVQKLGRDKQSKIQLKFAVFLPLIPPYLYFSHFYFLDMQITLSEIKCRLNFENRPVRSRDIKGSPKQPHPLPLIGVARSLPLIGLTSQQRPWIMHMPTEVVEQLLDVGPECSSFCSFCLLTDPVLRAFLYHCRMAHNDGCF